MEIESLSKYKLEAITPDRTYGRIMIDHFDKDEFSLVEVGYYKQRSRQLIDRSFRYSDRQVHLAQRESFLTKTLERSLVGLTILGLFGGVLLFDRLTANTQEHSNYNLTPTPQVTITPNNLAY